MSSPGTMRAPDFERIPVSAAGRVVGRAPVELAWARTRRPVLIALLANLKGLYLDEGTQTPALTGILGNPDRIGTLRSAKLLLDWTATSDDCRRTADALLAFAGPLDTWQKWNAFCDTLFTDPAALAAALAAAQAAQNAAMAVYVTDPTIANWNAYLAAEAALFAAPAATALLNQAKRDILKANFNPNSDLNKFNPNQSAWKTVDKSDLLAYSTEFSLFPVGGLEIESAGRVVGPRGKLLGKRVLKVTLQGPSVLRLTTQKEFVCEDLGNLDFAGDETMPRQMGHPRFVSQSRGLDRTWGHRLDVSGLSPAADYAATWMNGNSLGASLQSYPEPCYNLTPGSAAGMSIRPADYDGNLQLATLETRSDDYFYTVPAPPATSARELGMLARFDDAMDLDVAKSGVTANQTDTSQVAAAEMGNSLLDYARPNTLYPDGVYSDKDRVPAWRDKGSANGHRGVLSFWVKSNRTQIKNGFQMRGQQYVHAPNALGVSDRPFFLGRAGYDWTEVPYSVLFFENSHKGNGTGNDRGVTSTGIVAAHTHQFQVTSAVTPRRWSLFTAYYDTAPDDLNSCGRVVLDGGGVPLVGQVDMYEGSSSGLPNWHIDPDGDLTQDEIISGIQSAHLLSLGLRRPFGDQYALTGFNTGGGADATLDEFAYYDFGGATYDSGLGIATPAPADSLNSPMTLASARYPQGRYYKGAVYKAANAPALPAVIEEAASYLTAPLRLPAGTTLWKVSWTWCRSSDAALAQDYAQVELVKSSGTEYLWPGTSASNGKTDGALQSWSGMEARSVSGDFRARVVFLRPPVAQGGPDLSNKPILDSPVLDDLTFVYTPPGGRRVIAWGEGE